jgi:hypothetical protein
MTSKPRKRKTGGDPYRRGYGNGVTAAVDALLDDLADAGKLDTEYDDDGIASVCKGCMLHDHGFHGQATRWEFAVGLDRHPRGKETAT